MIGRSIGAAAALLLAAGAAGAQTLTITDVMISEADVGTQTADVFVQLTGFPDGIATVEFTTEDGTAAAGKDYQPVAGILVFMNPESQKISVPIVGDLEVEPDETFSVFLSNAVNAVILDNEAIVTIVNDDQVVGDPSIDDATVTEGDAGTVSAVFDVRLPAPAQQQLTYNYETRNATAIAGEDYQATAGNVVFMPGEMVKTVAVDVFGDTVFEGDETFVVRISDGVGVIDTATGTILDDDERPALAIGSVGVFEGDAGVTEAVFSVTLSSAPSETVTAAYATRDGSATAASGDYASVAGTLTFSPGEIEQSLTVEVLGDTALEADETFFVDLSEASGATIVDGQGEGTILNDDREPPALTIGDASVVEGDEGRVLATFSVQLSRATDDNEGAVSVDVATGDGTATAADGDYLPASGSLVFTPGQTQLELTVEVVGDTRAEPDETFSVALSNPDGATIADGEGEGTILNDDEEPSRVRLLDAPSVAESAGTVAVSVERFGGSERAARVTVTALAGTATAGEDFVAASRVVSWDARETGRKVFEVEILDDALLEDDETIVLRLSSPVDATLADPAQRTLVILDDDAPMDLEPVGDAEVTAGVGEELELAVRASRGDGAPVAGATVVWGVEGDAELLSGERTRTDDQGVAGQRLRLGSRAGEVVVSASLEGADAGVEFALTVESGLVDAIDPTEDPGGAEVARTLDQSCAGAGGDFGDMCDYLTALGDADQRTAIAELTPEEVAAQAQVALGAQKTQLANVGSRLKALRAGAASSAAGQLALLIHGQPLDLGVIRSAWASRFDDRRYAKRVDSAVAAALAGAAAGTRQEAGGEGGAAPSGTAAGAPRWGLFVNGRISIGDRPTTVNETGFDFETLGLTAGADYRLSHRVVIGAALGYLDTDTDLAADGGRLDATGTSLSAYASYARDSFYLDGVVGYGRNSYDLTRNVDLPQPFQGRQRYTAVGSPDGSQLSASLSAGYDAQVRAFTVGGFGGLSWIDSTIDAYVERDAGPFNLALADQDVESLLAEAGVELAYAASRSWGVLRPSLRLSFLHELEDDARLIRARFLDDLTGNELAIPTEEPDRDFVNLTAGLTATLARGRTLYVIYDTDLERDDLDVYTFTFGARFEL